MYYDYSPLSAQKGEIYCDYFFLELITYFYHSFHFYIFTGVLNPNSPQICKWLSAFPRNFIIYNLLKKFSQARSILSGYFLGPLHSFPLGLSFSPAVLWVLFILPCIGSPVQWIPNFASLDLPLCFYGASSPVAF